MTALTRVTLGFIAEQKSFWLRFGQPLRIERRPEGNHFAFFAPRARFCYVRWQANAYGTTDWWLAILGAVDVGARAASVLDVSPGADVLLQVAGSAKVKQVFALIDSIEVEKIPLEAVSADYWRAVNTRLVVRETPPVYSREQHAAYVARRELLA